jgi:hypothetical protein
LEYLLFEFDHQVHFEQGAATNESDRGGYFTHQVEDESKNIEYAVVNNQTIRHLFLICTIILLF